MISQQNKRRIRHIVDTLARPYPIITFYGNVHIHPKFWIENNIVRNTKNHLDFQNMNMKKAIPLLICPEVISQHKLERIIKNILSKDKNSAELGRDMLYRQSFLTTYPKLILIKARLREYNRSALNADIIEKAIYKSYGQFF